jgi:MGT family glycosyltransferase
MASTDRPRSYLFALLDGGGTVPPELGAARRLVERGHRVEVIAENSMRQEVEFAGAAFRPWVKAMNRPGRGPDHDVLQDWQLRTPMQFVARMLDRVLAGPAPDLAADLMDAVGDHRPDVVVCDMFALGAMVGAEAAGLPYFVLMPNIYALPARSLPPFGLGTATPANVVATFRDRVVTAIIGRAWNKGLSPINELRTGLGLKPIHDFWDQVRRACKILVLTSPSFDFPAELPDNVRYVGPVLDDPAWALEATPPLPSDVQPLAVVAMSSTYQNQERLLQRVIDALATLPIRAIVTTGPAIQPESLRAAANVTVVASAPHSQLMRQASAVVTHGGHGTVVRALAAGAPLVVIPQGRDQPDNAVRVEIRNAGITLKRSANTKTIAAAVNRLLADPQYRQSALRLGAAIRRDAASDALVAELENAGT